MPSVDRSKASHATDPEKKAGSHLIETKNRDSMPTVDRGRKGGTVGGKASNATDPEKKAGSHFIETKNREWYVTEEVNPLNKLPLSEKGSRFANTKRKAAAQLVFEGTVPSFKSCTAYIISWTKEANDTESKTIFIQGKKMRRKDCGSLSSFLKSLKTLPQ